MAKPVGNKYVWMFVNVGYLCHTYYSSWIMTNFLLMALIYCIVYLENKVIWNEAIAQALRMKQIITILSLIFQNFKDMDPISRTHWADNQLLKLSKFKSIGELFVIICKWVLWFAVFWWSSTESQSISNNWSTQLSLTLFQVDIFYHSNGKIIYVIGAHQNNILSCKSPRW